MRTFDPENPGVLDLDLEMARSDLQRAQSSLEYLLKQPDCARVRELLTSVRFRLQYHTEEVTGLESHEQPAGGK